MSDQDKVKNFNLKGPDLNPDPNPLSLSHIMTESIINKDIHFFPSNSKRNISTQEIFIKKPIVTEIATQNNQLKKYLLDSPITEKTIESSPRKQSSHLSLKDPMSSRKSDFFMGIGSQECKPLFDVNQAIDDKVIKNNFQIQINSSQRLFTFNFSNSNTVLNKTQKKKKKIFESFDTGTGYNFNILNK